MADEHGRQQPETNPKAPPPEEFKRIYPTLYIGLGGTGKEIILRLRRRILQTLWNGKRIESLEEFPVASFLYFDTYAGKAEDENRALQDSRGAMRDPLRKLVELSPSDCVQEKDFRPEKYISEIERYPLIQEWLPPGDVHVFVTPEGAGQVRPAARLLFFHEARDLNKAINEKARTLLHNVGNEERLRALGLEIEPQVKIVVLCSLAGATGSGVFLDTGYLCKSLQNPRPKEVILYGLLGGNFEGLNDRVLANTYAALAELEYCMRSSRRDAYVKAWAPGLSNEALRPYDEVYLIDNANFGNQRTGERDHLYRMIADILFEELHDPALRGKRREDLVNQKQYKLFPFIPPQMPQELGAHSQRFSRAYSSCGQVTLYTRGRTEFELETAQAARDMLKAFFRIAETDKRNHPTPPEVAEFMTSQLHLGVKYFQDFPEFLGDASGRSLDDFHLVDRLLQQGETPLDQVVRDQIRESFGQIRNGGSDPSEWPAQVENIRRERDREIEGSVDSSSRDATYPRILREQRNRIRSELETGLRTALYARLDNREKGGLTYVISLVREVRDALTVEGTGVCHRLNNTARELDELARQLRQGYYTRALQNLDKAARKGFLRGPDREACEDFLRQAEQALCYYFSYRVRAIACREAVALLRDQVIPMLGQPSIIEEGIGATGIVAEFEQGQAAVRTALEELEAEIRVLDDALKSQTPLRKSIPGRGLPEGGGVVDKKQLAEWGADALSEHGGSRELFAQLRDDKTRPRIISALRGRAREKMQERERLLPTVQQVLSAMPEQERRRLFEEAFRCALPWVNCDMQRLRTEQCWDPKMMTIFVAVENAPEFLQQFGHEIRAVLPSEFLGKELYAVSSAERGRLVVYSELSGIPLNALVGLHDDWRRAYETRSSGEQCLPLHNHRMAERFARPTAMNVEELRELHRRLKLFLKGVGLGVLRRRPDGRYELNVSRSHVADWQAIGREQLLYVSGFPHGKEETLRRKVEQVEGRMTPKQKLLAAALFSCIAYRSYAPIKVQLAGGAEARYGGIAHHAALALCEEYKKQFDAAPGRSSIPAKTEDLLAALEQSIDEWAQRIPGSVNDTTPEEANIDPDEGDAEWRAVDKWWVDLARITDEQIDHWAGLTQAKTVPSETQYYLAVDGKLLGPFGYAQIEEKRLRGELTERTLVWRKGLANWTKAVDLDDLKHLFDAEIPPPLPPSQE